MVSETDNPEGATPLEPDEAAVLMERHFDLNWLEK